MTGPRRLDLVPDDAGDEADGSELPRRRLLQLIGASLAAAAVEGCFRTPDDKLVPYGRKPELVTPGIPLHYATSYALGGYATGLVVESWQGHPTKIEGNARHPASLGAATFHAQALPMDLYDPARSRTYSYRQRPVAPREFVQGMHELAQRFAASGGAGLAFLLEPSASPTLGDLVATIRKRYPKARLFTHDAFTRDNLYEGASLAFGQPVESLVHFERAKVVLALDADFLVDGPSASRDARNFVETRDPLGDMSRLWVVEPSLTLTGMFADERLRVKPTEVRRVAEALAHELARSGLAELERVAPSGGFAAFPEHESWIRAVARDLVEAKDRGVVVVGAKQPKEVVALVHAIDAALGRGAAVVDHVAPTLHDLRTGPAALSDLVQAMREGHVDTLVVTAYDPVYTAAADLAFGAALGEVPHLVYTALRDDQTSARAEWFAPARHFLESWGDACAQDGTVGIVQPLVASLFGGVQVEELLAPFAGASGKSPYELVRARWGAACGPSDAPCELDDWLADGVVPDVSAARIDVAIRHDAIRDALAAAPLASSHGLEIEFLRTSRTWDGRYAGNAWLVELPDPITKISWCDPARISQATAARLHLTDGDFARIEYGGRSLVVQVFVLAGQADDTISLALGWGRPGPPPGEHFASANAYALRQSFAPWFDAGANLVKLERHEELPNAQEHFRMEGRDLAMQAKRDDFVRDMPTFLRELKGPVEQLYRTFPLDRGYQWAMAVDLNRCIGCEACILACQSENNIPVVGPENVRLGRIMHWLRVDRYFEGAMAEPSVVTQPVACVHCEAAPCEYVCPVNATVHDLEGINEMVYNRCVGTRFCSNNCPYKVRRFNYFHYTPRTGGLDTLARNPNVTVRSRGVMEKCTYCIQRIERARIDARSKGRHIDTVALQTACEQTCPTRAITFGSLTEEASPVAVLHRDARRYDLLHDLGTRPRTAYLARIKNPRGGA